MSNILSCLLIIIFLLCLESIFAGCEMALVASDINKIRYQVSMSKSRSNIIVLKLLENPEWFLAITLTGTNICIIAESVLATSIFIDLVGLIKGQFFSVLIMIPVILIFGEIIPKSIFQSRPEKMAIRFSWFIFFISIILYPIIFLVSNIAKLAIFIVQKKENGKFFSPYVTKQGLKFLLKQKFDKNDFYWLERDMARKVIEFSEKTASNLMVPLSHVTSVEENISFTTVASQLKGKWFSRIPVYKSEIYNVIGILYGFDLLKILPDSQNELVYKFMRKPFFVPETKKANELLLDMQKNGEQMAIVVNEYGGSVGIITVEDLLEEIVGDIQDEYDIGEFTYKKIGHNKLIFNAHTSIHKINDVLKKTNFPSGDYETLGGFLLTRLGRIPRKGERFNIKNIQFIIQATDPKTIKEVMLILPYDIEKK